MFTNTIRTCVLTVMLVGAGQLLWAQQTENEDNLMFALQEQISEPSTTQNVLLKEVIELNISTASIEDALTVIAGKLELKLMYSEEALSVGHRVSIQNQRMTLYEALWEVLEGTGLKFAISSNRQLVVIKDPNYTGESVRELVQRTISGTVTDANTGEPVPGATIIVEGSSTGTTTDMDGIFSLTVPDDTETLLISFVGYQSQEVSIAGQSEINVELEQDLLMMDEMVVVGYGSQARSDVTGSISTVSAEDIENLPVRRLDEALQGSSSGVVVNKGGNDPEGTVKIRIRGVNSIQGDNDPLVVVDGFVGGDISRINPNDIESIQVLKDASATAIYGSRGSNGVILVQTKQGQQQTSVEYNGYMTFQSNIKEVDLMSAAQYAETVNANRLDAGRPAVFTQEQINNFRQNGGTDWQDEVFRTGMDQRHQLSIGGGSQDVTYYISGNYSDTQGIVRNTSFTSYALQSNLTANLGEKFKVGVRANLSQSENHPRNGFRDNDPVYSALVFPPTEPIYQQDGTTYTQPPGSHGYGSIFNPVGLAEEPVRDDTDIRILANASVDYQVMDNLTARVLVGVTSIDSKLGQYVNTDPQGGVGQASASVNNSEFMLLQNTNQLTYRNTFSGLHDVGFTAVYEQQQEVSTFTNVGSDGFSTDAVLYNNLSLGQNPNTPSSGKSEKTIHSYMGRLNYGYDSRYLFTLTGRYDGSSVFGANNKWGFFPSASVAWNISNESFMENVDAVSNLKLRASYGITGSQAIGPYNSLSSLSTGREYSNPSGGSIMPGTGLGSLGNPDLKWETTSQFDIGFDLSLLDDRITATVDYYNKITDNLLLNQPLPRTSGYSSILQNIGSVGNSGFEFSLGGYPVNQADLQWRTNFNISFNKNEVLDLVEGQEEIGFTGFGLVPGMGNTIFLIEGEPMGILRGFIQDGTWNTDEAAEAASYGTIPGAPKYIDQNNDGVINSDDITRMGQTLPKFSYGWNNTVQYKNFSLNVFMQGVYGNDVFDISAHRYGTASHTDDGTSTVLLDRWTPDNQDTDVPSFEGALYGQSQSSYWMQDGSYLRVKNITLGYTLPESVLSQLDISSVRLYVTGINLITITNFEGIDPEMRSGGAAGSDFGGGINISSYPAQRGLTVGMDINF